MATLTMPEAFLQDVIEHRDDDAPRLIYADWLEERGDEARADFIRVQCELARLDATGYPTAAPTPERIYARRRRERELLETHRTAWTALVPGVTIDAWSLDEPMLPYTYGVRALFRRGFVAEITCCLGDWCGGPCWHCHGEPARVLDSTFGHDGTITVRCSACKGTGRTPGHGPALVRAAPLERVTLSDREPWDRHISGRWWWVAEGTPTFTGHQVPESCFLPADLMRYLPSEGLPRGYGLTAWRTPGGRGSRQAAKDAASAALLAWARARPATS